MDGDALNRRGEKLTIDRARKVYERMVAFPVSQVNNLLINRSEKRPELQEIYGRFGTPFRQLYNTRLAKPIYQQPYPVMTQCSVFLE